MLIKRIQTHQVIYTDTYEIPEEEFTKRFGSREKFLSEVMVESGFEGFKVGTTIDEVSNRRGDYEEEWWFENEWFCRTQMVAFL